MHCPHYGRCQKVAAFSGVSTPPGLDFLRLPRLSENLEQHLSRCSRAMLSLAKVADVLVPGSGNRSCSSESIRARYPLKLEDEALYEGGEWRGDREIFIEHFPVASTTLGTSRKNNEVEEF